MPASAPQEKRIDLETLVAEYESARQAAGIGDRGWRLTPGQHLDAHRLVAAMRAQNGIAGAGADVDVWVNYLAPILAESGPAKQLLREVMAGHRPNDRGGSGSELSRELGPDRDPSSRWTRIRKRLSEAFGTEPGSIGWTHFAAFGLMAAGIVGVIVWTNFPRPLQRMKQPDLHVATDAPKSGPRPVPDAQAVASAFLSAWATTDAAIKDPKFVSGGITPRRLAAVHANADPRLGSPDILLANILRMWPVPPDIPIHASGEVAPGSGKARGGVANDGDQSGLATLKRLTGEIAVLRSGFPRVLFDDQVSRANMVVPPIPAGSTSPTHAVVSPWPKEFLYLAGAPLLGYIFYAAATHRRRVRKLTDRWLMAERRSMRRARSLEGFKQSSSPLMAVPPQPLVDRASLRALVRYRPAAGRRLDAPRSVAALMHQEGVADPVMRRVQRAVSYLVIIQRRQPHDHERLRVRRLMALLAERGLPVFAYDYDHDPLTVKNAIAASINDRREGINGREETLKLSTLRDLYPKARLVLVTDGRDLVDRISGRVQTDVVKGLSFWRDRMVLTPVPVGDWGEVEFALSRDLDAPLGRTGEEAIADLAEGFRESAHTPLHRLALMQARSFRNAAARLDAWWYTVSERFGYAAGLSRGEALSFDQRLLVTDLQPPKPVVEAIRDDLYRWLGARGFLWHAACAIYPQLRFDLTVHIGRVLRSGSQADAPALFRDTAEDRRTFDRMAALPWFRSGRMPGWLRQDMLKGLDQDTRMRATAVIRDLFEVAPGRQGPLAVWWPRTGALAMPPDAVMVDALLGEAVPIPEEVLAQRTEELRRHAERKQWVREAYTALLVALVCAGFGFFAPDFANAPHARGAWFPLFSFASGCIATLGLVTYVSRKWPVELPPPPRQGDDQQSTTTITSKTRDSSDGPIAA